MIYKLTMFLVALLPGTLGFSLQSNISGTITNAESGEGVSFAYVHIEEINRTSVSDIDGNFELNNVPDGTYTLTIHRIGYRTQSQQLELTGSDVDLDIKLSQTVLSSQSVEVIGKRENIEGSNLEHASKKVFGSELRKNLGSTLSQTLTNLPGFDQRSNGTAPGRPVIRGLGDERVLILQDGVRSGDVSSQNSDHAVSIDPVAAQEIEIARGPAALAYGANAIGGVINVVKNQISTSVPSRLNGTATLSGETVNTGGSGALNIAAPLGTFALTADINGRAAGNTQTPEGEIQNSFFKNTNDALGLSWVQDWGYIGGSASVFATEYGIPPNPNGEAEGVNIEAFKYQFDLKSEILIKNSAFKQLELNYSFKDYTHDEIERAGRGAVGSAFDLLTTNASIRTRHDELGVLDKGRLGLWLEAEDLIVFGDNTPPSNSYKFGSYWIEEKDIGRLHLEAGLRFDYVQNRPDRPDPNSDIGNIRKREFTALSSSGAAFYALGGGFTTGVTLLHSFRAPSLEELYSEGPHLATFTFEVGNPSLDPERGLAKELVLRYNADLFSGEFTVFHNGFSNFLFARNTGRTPPQRADLEIFQFEGAPAQLYGFEAASEWQISDQFVFNGSISYTIGERDLTDAEQAAGNTSEETQPLPQIPPLKGKIELKYAKQDFEIGSRAELAAEQTRTGDFEKKTDGYQLVDIFAQYRFSAGKLLHTISLNANNLFDATYRNHLSIIKEVVPEPGRNISLLYRIYF